jgi:hypothetical protein
MDFFNNVAVPAGVNAGSGAKNRFVKRALFLVKTASSSICAMDI